MSRLCTEGDSVEGGDGVVVLTPSWWGRGWVDEGAYWSPGSLLRAESESDDGDQDEERAGATTQRV